jgi:hypothetical protein
MNDLDSFPIGAYFASIGNCQQTLEEDLSKVVWFCVFSIFKLIIFYISGHHLQIKNHSYFLFLQISNFPKMHI